MEAKPLRRTKELFTWVAPATPLTTPKAAPSPSLMP